MLTCLGSLACLSLGHTEHLPACLPQLTGLHELALESGGVVMEDDAFQAAVDAALQQLTGVSAWRRAGGQINCSDQCSGVVKDLRRLMLQQVVLTAMQCPRHARYQ